MDLVEATKCICYIESMTMHINPKGGGGGPKVPAGQEIACHFSQDCAMVTKILDFIHKHLN